MQNSSARFNIFFALIWIAPPNRVLFSSKAKGATFAPHYKLVPAPQGLHVRLNLDKLKATNKQSGFLTSQLRSVTCFSITYTDTVSYNDIC